MADSGEDFRKPVYFDDPDRKKFLIECGQAIGVLANGTALGGAVELDDATVEMGVPLQFSDTTSTATLGAKALSGFASLVGLQKEIGQTFPEGALMTLFHDNSPEDGTTSFVISRPVGVTKALKSFFVWGSADWGAESPFKVLFHPEVINDTSYELASKLGTPHFVVSGASYLVNLTTQAIRSQ